MGRNRTFWHTNNATAQAVAWGVSATSILSAAFSALAAIAFFALFILVSSSVIPILLFPVMLVVALVAPFLVDFYARRSKESDLLLSNSYDADLSNSPGKKVALIEDEERAAWRANNVRNFYGYIVAPAIGLGFLALSLALGAAGYGVPIAGISISSISILLPTAFCGAVGLVLVSLIAYAVVKDNTWEDNRYKLATNNQELVCSIYLDELGPDIQSFLKKEQAKHEGDAPQQLVHKWPSFCVADPRGVSTVASPPLGLLDTNMLT